MIELKVISAEILAYGIPTTETSGAAGYDLRACLKAPITVYPESSMSVPTGVAVHIKDKNLAGFVMPRSGLAAKHRVTLQNAVGLIDSDYQGELKVLIRNEGDRPFIINPGDRIAQLVFVPVVHPVLAVVTDFGTDSVRGSSGFGSTGVESRPLSQGTSLPVDTGYAFPTQSIGNDEKPQQGHPFALFPIYESTGQEQLEMEYGS